MAARDNSAYVEKTLDQVRRCGVGRTAECWVPVVIAWSLLLHLVWQFSLSRSYRLVC